ncbi:fatty acid desaturase family protein [Nocardia shimofusensis]|uniref:fatty acid desaturase family protein n=1 Tax=Nocardia shimofusensis TaxID=228596 RepID=UPI00082CCEA7|nr:fatty acid desaturase [Nocardia shimofusensis]
MAITRVAAYAHLSDEDIEAFGAELDRIRAEVTASRGSRDARYIHRTIAFQRCLEVAARLTIGLTRKRSGWAAGTAMLALAKSVENMEIGHNVGHGQWDWMNDPEIHSGTWEWDMVGASAQWRYSHNYRHHVFTNVVGMDDDVGFGVLRVTRDEPWRLEHLFQPLRNIVLALFFEWGIALHDLYSEHERVGTATGKAAETRALAVKVARQMGKDYLLFPALSGRRWRRTLTADICANLVRNVWAYVVIFCGHFPDGAEKFAPSVLEHETKGQWYLRQLLGSANFRAGPVLAFLSGHLSHQIEHHLFPDLPCNRYPEIAIEVRELCARYNLPYTTGSLLRQYLLALRTIHKLALPDRLLIATSDDAPETASEKKFALGGTTGPAEGPDSTVRAGLLTAMRR